jgi:uncharacterized membrane protein
MSSVSQTPPQNHRGGGRGGFGRWFAVSMVVMVVILVIALWGAWPYIAQTAARARPHAPDMALWARLTLPIRLHVMGALGALVVGAVLMTQRKGRLFHRTAGWMWVCLVSLVAGSSLFITSLNHGRWSILHLFTGWTLIALPLGVMWAKRHNVAQHRRFMMGLFYGGFAVNLLIAFIPGRTMWNLLFG